MFISYRAWEFRPEAGLDVGPRSHTADSFGLGGMLGDLNLIDMFLPARG